MNKIFDYLQLLFYFSLGLSGLVLLFLPEDTVNSFLPEEIVQFLAEEVPYSDLVERKGIAYKINYQSPFTGYAYEYHDNGQLLRNQYFKDGKRQGLIETFYDNGQIAHHENFRDGKKEGLTMSYSIYDGQLEEKRNYRDGKLDGLLISYRNERISGKDCYKDGNRQGEYIDFNFVSNLDYCEK
jgi:antitoxin component YwqK of YwqJK toxin-antitoxin module